MKPYLLKTKHGIVVVVAENKEDAFRLIQEYEEERENPKYSTFDKTPEDLSELDLSKEEVVFYWSD